jgi:molecular chaperone HscB
MIDPFETLGIAPTFDVDLASVEKRYREMARVLHPDRHVAGSPADRRVALGKAVEVNEAWRLIRDPIRRAEALLEHRGVKIEEGKAPKPDPEFLMEMMEQREALAEARASRDPARVEALAADIRRREKDVLVRIATAFVSSGPPGNVVPLLGELRYYRRFLDEVSAIEDGLHDAADAARDDQDP